MIAGLHHSIVVRLPIWLLSTIGAVHLAVACHFRAQEKRSGLLGLRLGEDLVYMRPEAGFGKKWSQLEVSERARKALCSALAVTWSARESRQDRA